VAQLVALARPLVAAVLYLCSAEADVIDPDRPGGAPRRAMVPGEAPRVWEVGYRLATALRRARLGSADHGAHAGPRPHLRRAHCWTGPRESSERRLVLRWVLPTLVAAGAHDSPAVVRELT